MTDQNVEEQIKTGETETEERRGGDGEGLTSSGASELQPGLRSRTSP